MTENKYVVILITVGSDEEAVNIGKTLVEENLVACANIFPQISSIFHWKGKICDEREVLLCVKSRASLFKKIKERVIGLHSYDVPEIIALSIHLGSEDYLSWIDEVTED